MKQMSNLLETVEEGLLHIKQLLNEGKFEQSTFLFGDMIQAFSTLEYSLTEFPEEVISVQSGDLINKVRQALDLVVTSYKAGTYGRVQEIMQFTLIPRFKKWKGSLSEVFKDYIVN